MIPHITVINDIKVKKIVDKDKIDQINKCEEIYGKDTKFPVHYINAKRGSGKTSSFLQIIKNCCVKNYKFPYLSTQIRFFSPTTKNDLTMQAILKKIDKYNMMYDIFEEFDDNMLSEMYQQDTEFIIEHQDKLDKQKYIYPVFILVFDDISQLLRSKSLETILKKSRHNRYLIIISTQHSVDLPPGSRYNITHLSLYKGVPLDKLKQYHKDYMGELRFDQFEDVYNFCTREKYNFMFFETNNKDNIRLNFDKLITL